MASLRVEIPPEIRDIIRILHPSEKRVVAGVLDLLENDFWRDTHRVDFGVIDGLQTWAIAEAAFTVAFVEAINGPISVLYLSKRSRFRPNWV